MKKKVLIVLFSVFVAGFYAQAQAQKINVVSVSKERDIHNFYTMMKEAFPLAYNDPAAPRFIFFDDNKNFIFGVGGYVQLSGVYDFNGVEDYNFFTTSTIAMKGHQQTGADTNNKEETSGQNQGGIGPFSQESDHPRR